MHSSYTAADVMPPVPAGCSIRTEALDGQIFVSGGFFKAGTQDRKFSSLAKSAVLSLDVDACDCPAILARLELEDRKTAKQRLYSMTEEQVRQLFDDVGFVAWAVELNQAAGLPPAPNRLIYSGHGIQFIYWLSADMGWSPELRPDEEWTPKRLKEALRQFVRQAAPVHVDASAVDIGTRIFPLPGCMHRSSPKRVAVLDGHDEPFDLRGWFNELEQRYPAPRRSRKARRPSSPPREKGAAAEGDWTRTIWLNHYPALEEGERAPCPLCNGSGYKRMSDHYSCFSCRTQFQMRRAEELPAGHRRIRLDARGYMVLPDERPPFLVLKTATGSGKTRLLEDYSRRHQVPGFSARKVIAISPYISLAEQLAARVGVLWAAADSDHSLRSGSVAMCLASMPSKADVTRRDQLEQVCLMIDESETVLSQLYSMLRRQGRDVEAYNALLRVAIEARQVICCDQNAGPATEQFLADINAAREAAGLEPRAFEWWVSAHYRHRFLEVQPIWRTNKKGEQVIATGADEVHKGLIHQQLLDGKRLAIYAYGRAYCRGLARQLRRRFPALTIRCVVGSKSRDSKNDLSTSGLTGDVLIYNNAMSTGVSFDVPDHYHHVHLLVGSALEVTGDMLEQAAHRVRAPADRRIFISGATRDVVNDWRCEPRAHLQRARDLLDAEQHFARALLDDGTLTLRSDYMVSADAQRVAWVQAVVVASEYQRGRGWPLHYLATRHQVVPYHATAADEDVGALHREAVQQVRQMEADDIAAALPLDDAGLDRVNAQGAATDQEADEAAAARMVKCYGPAYEDADQLERAALVLEHDAGLWPRVEVYAHARCFGNRRATAGAVRRLQRANEARTDMTAVTVLLRAAIFHTALRALELAPEEEEVQVTPALALAICKQMRRRVQDSGALPMHSDWRQRPMRQLGAWLRLGGLRWSVRSTGPENARVRSYWMTRAELRRMDRLSEHRFQTISADLVDG